MVSDREGEGAPGEAVPGGPAAGQWRLRVGLLSHQAGRWSSGEWLWVSPPPLCTTIIATIHLSPPSSLPPVVRPINPQHYLHHPICTPSVIVALCASSPPSSSPPCSPTIIIIVAPMHPNCQHRCPQFIPTVSLIITLYAPQCPHGCHCCPLCTSTITAPYAPLLLPTITIIASYIPCLFLLEPLLPFIPFCF